MNEDKVVEHLLDIKERLASIETYNEEMRDNVKEYIEFCRQTDIRVDKLEKEQTKAKAALRTLRWVIGILFISIPATLAALSRLL